MPAKHLNLTKIFPRGPSFRGKFMLDVSQGKTRARAWPKKRGKPKTEEHKEQVEWFRQANMLCKYIDPKEQIVCMQARSGTPLLPRDLMLMIMATRMYMFQMSDGRRIYPMPAIQDVSDSLDVLSYIEGAILCRFSDRWRPILPGMVGQVLTTVTPDSPPEWVSPGGSGGGAMSLIAFGTVSSAVPYVQVDGMDQYSEFAVKVLNMTASINGVRCVRGSNNAFASSGGNQNMDLLAAAGTVAGDQTLGRHTGSTTAARTFTTLVQGNRAGGLLSAQSTAGNYIGGPFALPINSIRIENSTGGTMNGGTWEVWAH